MLSRKQLTVLVHQLNTEANHCANERDHLIQAVRDALHPRDDEWFPDGFPSSDNAIDAILWLGDQIRDLGGIPSRYDD